MIKYSDSKAANEKWEAFAEAAGTDTASAMKELYSLYDADLVLWLASLYEPRYGGFYFSESARDNDVCVHSDRECRLLPDVESTCQALGIINASGMLSGRAENYSGFLPEKMKKQIADAVYGMQDPDGYFYHEQWGKDIGISRRARDLAWSRSILSTLGREMKYPSILSSGEKQSSETLIPDHLSSKTKFIEYLDSLNLNENCYPAGNNLSAQSIQIKSVGLMDTCIEYLSEKQNPKTGLWHSASDYYAVNGLMKISGVYNSAGKPLPHSREAALAAIDAICSDTPIRAVVDLWNTWVAVGRITENLERLGGVDGAREAEEIRSILRKNAAPAIRKSLDKLRPFKREMSSFSYLFNRMCTHSQGAPVAPAEPFVGDLNATMIASTHMVGSIFDALGLRDYSIRLYGSDEADAFLEAINKKLNM